MVHLFREHQAVYKELKAAEAASLSLPQRIYDLHGVLRETIDLGLKRDIERALNSLEEMRSADGVSRVSFPDGLLSRLGKRLGSISDDEDRDKLADLIIELQPHLT